MQGALSKVASSASIAGSAISVALDLAGSDDENFVSANEGMIADEMVEVLGHTVMPGSDHPNGRRVVLIIDDIQWIDDDSLRVLNILLERLVDRFVSVETIMQNRVCILMTCRTDVSADSEGEPDQVAAAQAKLEELSQRGVVNLITPEPVHDILGTDENSLEWRNQLLNTIRCTERARRGISREMELKGLELPLHRLEFIKIAIAQGALKIVDGRIDLEPSIPLHDISPGTEFRDMVANELKGLDRLLLDILHCCAIIGRSFQISLVAKIFDIDIIELLSLLKEAESRKIVIDCTKADDIYEFRDKRIAGAFRAKSGLDPTEVQQMAREYHRRFVLIRGGELDAKYARESSIPFTEVLAIATHAATVAESMPLETIRWSRMAAARCEQRRLYGRAIRELEPALSLINNRDDLAIPTLQRIELFLMHAQLTLDAEEQADLALASLEQAQCLLDRCVDADDEINHRISLLRGLAMYQQRRFSDAANTVQAVADDPSAPVWMGARAHFVIALSMDPRTQAADKHQVLEELLTATITAIKESTDPLATHHLILLQSEICNSLGMSRLHHAGDTQGAQEIFQRSIELNRSPRVADRKGEAIGHGGLGDVYKTTGRIEEARDSYELNLSISRETGDVAGIMRMTSMLGGIAMEEYESETTQAERARHLNEARRYYEESALLAVKSKRTIALKFALEGLIRIEVAEKASGAMLVQTIEEAITEGSVDTMVADAVLQAIADVELPATAIEQIKTLLKPLAS